ncbi:oligomeric, coiled-coil, peripheral membrane protein [Tulasnella sp. JGI-2019a]|nr:oligomeric, coiled-coil, peripheral membrane protein [Tulasnella sp. JGI-2019a]
MSTKIGVELSCEARPLKSQHRLPITAKTGAQSRYQLLMRIIRAEDGEIFDTDTTFTDIEQSGSLKAFLSNVTSVDENGLICFTSDGMQLRQESLREMAGSEDQSVFVFSREYLDMPVESVLQELAVTPQLQPEVDDAGHTSSSAIISAYSRAANFHYQHIIMRSSSIYAQSDSLAVASKNLDVHVLSLTSAYENFAASAQRELEKQDEVLRGHALDMDVISRVKVHAEFLSPAGRRAVEMGGKERHLGDYVSVHKMKTVAESCETLHDDLVARFNSTRAAMTDLATGADEVRLAASNPFAADVEICLRRAKDLSERITLAPYEAPVDEIRELDAALRGEVLAMAELKNRSTTHSIDVLRHVSRLQSTLADMPSVLTSLDADLRPKAGFPHLQRLHNMLYVYGATVVEIVRRKEFAKIFMERAQTIAEMMAKMTANERKRRQVYRSEVHGQLPFEARGMDEPAPSLEISTNGSKEATFILTRDDLIEFLAVVDEISESTAPPIENSETQSTVIHPVKEVRAALDKLISRIDTLEADFDRLAEKSILSASWSANFSKRRTTNEASESAHRELMEQLQEKLEQERQLREDREGLEAENHRLRTELAAAVSERDRTAHESSSRLERLEGFEEEVQMLRDQVASETAARRSLEQRHSDSLVEAIAQASMLEGALADATEKTKAAELLKVELQRAKEDLAQATARHQESDNRVSNLLADQAETLRKMEDARSRGTDLEEQIRIAQEEGKQATFALEEAAREKETLLRAQANEADRLLRDQIAEANGDRAVLEHQFSEVRAELDRRTKEVGELKLELEMAHANQLHVQDDLDLGRREQERIVVEREQELRSLRADLEEGRETMSELKRRITAQERITRDIIKVALKMRDTNARAMVNAQRYIASGPKAPMGVTAEGSQGDGLASMTMSANFDNGQQQLPLSSSVSFLPHPSLLPTSHATSSIPQPLVDPSHPESALNALSAFDLDAFAETVNKTGSTIRKWQRQCKEYRDRAKGKITYRNFAKGDLALFLPTRNSVAKPWAAFNVSFPHYFLKAEGHLAEQLKTREWVVARITFIAERVADYKDPDSNPYGLGDGVKYFMLEVEDWTQPQPQLSVGSGTAKRQQAQKAVTSAGARSSSTPGSDSPPMSSGLGKQARVKTLRSASESASTSTLLSSRPIGSSSKVDVDTHGRGRAELVISDELDGAQDSLNGLPNGEYDETDDSIDIGSLPGPSDNLRTSGHFQALTGASTATITNGEPYDEPVQPSERPSSSSISPTATLRRPLSPPSLDLDSTTDEEQNRPQPQPLPRPKNEGVKEKEKQGVAKSPPLFVPLLDPIPSSPSLPTSPASSSPTKRIFVSVERRPPSAIFPSSNSQDSEPTKANVKPRAPTLSSSPMAANLISEESSSSSRSRPRVASSNMSTTLSVPFRGPTAATRKVPARTMTIPGAFVADDPTSPASASGGRTGGAGLLASPALSSSPSTRSNLAFDIADVAKVKAAPTTAVTSDDHLRTMEEDGKWQKPPPSPLSASPVRGDRQLATTRNPSPLKPGGKGVVGPAQLSGTVKGTAKDRGRDLDSVQGQSSRTPHDLSGKIAKVVTSDEVARTESDLAEAQAQTIGRSCGVVGTLGVDAGAGPSSGNSNASSSGVPSPAGSATEGLSSVLLGLGGGSSNGRQRVSSSNGTGDDRSGGGISTWSNWTNWGASLGRRSTTQGGVATRQGNSTSATSAVQDRLRRYESPGSQVSQTRSNI